jgi:hypothetical protein
VKDFDWLEIRLGKVVATMMPGRGTISLGVLDCHYIDTRQPGFGNTPVSHEFIKEW